MKSQTYLTSALMLASSVLLTACGGDDDNNDVDLSATYEITITNVTNAQPLSPPALVIHEAGYPAWSVGTAASSGLENLAESGSPEEFISEKQSYAITSASGDGVVIPGANIRINLDASWNESLQITIATMLVNTNDAFTGTTGLTIGQLEVGESISRLTPIYDAGTEENTETSATVPGPAAGGEGYNSERETRNLVTMHSGVVTQDDGLASSALTEAHRFDNGAMTIRIERTQ